ncbi:GTP-binding nuclear protein Ran-like [Drosophila willistoni]|uniref:GTP-binding nuclear protein Ran-like n=1 Tax=Drosophila willistoni TaxID=7260 RepID=UPI000C26CC4F|nr:GTP-binding nuclear protein Ran-like [Drosophila willistoni]
MSFLPCDKANKKKMKGKFGSLLAYKCVLIGDSGVGKTSYLKRLLTGEYPPTGDAVRDEIPLMFHTDRGNICLYILEADFKDLTDILQLNDFDCVVVMCDLSKDDPRMIRRFPSVIIKCFDCIPTVLIGNKRDAVDNGLEIENSYLVSYFEMSVKHNLNIVQPLQWLIRKVLTNDHIKFVEEYAPWPPEPLIDNCQSLGKYCEPKQDALEGNTQPEPSIDRNYLESIFLDVAFNSPLPEDDGIW